MANNKIQVKRTNVAGRTANVTNSGNTQYIDAGELALNMADGILYTSNGSSLITVGANQVNQRITNSLNLDQNKPLTFKTVNTAASVSFIQQNDDNFVFYTTNSTYGQRAVWSIFANNNTANLKFATQTTFNGNLDLNIVAVYANGSPGTAGQVLTTNGTSTYWSTVTGGGSVNTAAQYAWTNTHTFSANVSFNGNGIGITTNTGAIYLGGLADNNWKIGRNTGSTTKWVYTNNTIDIITANSNLEGFVVGLVSNNTYFETGYLGTYIASNVTVGNSTSNLTVNSTAFVVGNSRLLTTNAVFGGSVTANGSVGSAGQVLTSGGAANAYWTTPTTGTVTSVSSGNGLTGGPITSSGSLSVLANNGITANSTGVFVNGNSGLTVNSTGVHVLANTGIVANSTGTFVNATYIGTLSTNNASFLGGTAAASYQLNSTLSANVATLTANNTSFVGSTSAANVVSNTQLQSNLANYQTTAGLASNVATLAANSATFLGGSGNFGNSLGIYTSGVVNAATVQVGTSVVANSTRFVVGTAVGLQANGTIGAAGQVLHSNGTTVYWDTDDQGVTSVASGNGITGGTITSTGTLTAVAGVGVVVNTSGINVLANNGITANSTGTFVTAGNGVAVNSTGVHVLANTGIIANTTGTFVNASYIATISANNSSFLGGVAAASYVNSSQLSSNLSNYAALSGATFTGAVTVSNDLTVTGNLTLSGNTVIVGANNLVVSDAIISLHTPANLSALTSNDGRNIGLAFHYYDTEDKHALLYRDNSTGRLQYHNDGSDPLTNTNPTGNNLGIIQANSFWSGNDSVFATTNSTVYTGTANNTSFVGSVSAANVVSNSQLSGNLANYQTTAGLSANVATLAANSATFLGGAGNFGNSTGIYTSGIVNAVSFTAGNLIANNSILRSPSTLAVVGGGATAEGGQIVLGYGNNLSTTITGQANNTFNIDVTGGNTGSTPLLRIFAQHNDGTTTAVLNAANTGRVHIGSTSEQTDSTFKVTGTANITSNFTVGGNTTFAGNVVLGSVGLSANGGFGTAGHVLHSNGTATYWAADDNSGGTVTSVASGNGITGGAITTTGTLTAVAGAGVVVNTSGINVLANNGITSNSTGTFVTAGSGVAVNSTGVHVLANTGIIANTTGTFVNATYIGTISSNNASFLGGTAAASYQLNSTLSANVATLTSNNSTNFGGQLPAFYTNATNITTGTLPYAQIPSNIVNTTSNFTITGQYTFSTSPILPITVFSPSNLDPSVTNIGTTVGGGSAQSGRTIMGWNRSAGGGEFDIIINRNGGSVGGLNVYDWANTTSGNNTSDTLIFSVKGNGDGYLFGNVGIGNTTPNAKLQVTGTANVSGNVVIGGTLSSGQLTSRRTDTQTGYAEVASIVQNYSSTNTSILGFGQISNNRMYIESRDENNVKGTLSLQPYGGSVTVAGVTTFSANIILGSSGLSANGGFGTAGHTLHSNGTATYWDADDQGVTSVATGSGLTGGTITSTGTVSVLANTGIVANTTGLYVNSAYINTISSNNATFINGNNVLTVMQSLRANRNLNGGGTITVDGSGNVLWSARFIVISNGRGSHFGTFGYFEINCPTSGTITGVGGAANKIATAAGIPLAAWEALYYIMPIAGGLSTINGNFRVASYTSDLEIPSDWLLICVCNGDNNNYYFNNGVILKAGQSYVGGSHTSTVIGSNTFTVGTASYFVANGNVGIGTTSPSNKLQVTGGYIAQQQTDGSLARISLINTNRNWSLSNYGTAFSPTGSFHIADETAGLARFSIDSNGNTGIGVGSPNARLQVVGTANVSGNVVIGGATTFSANVVLGTTTITANGGVGTAGQVLTSGASGNVYWSTVASGGGVYMKGGTSTVGSLGSEGQNIFRVNANTLNNSTTIASGENAQATGPLTIASGITLTVSTGGRVSIV